MARAEAEHAYHLYVVRHAERDPLREALAADGVQTLVHYPAPVHRQPAFAHLRERSGPLDVTERLSAEIVSLPLFVGLAEAQLQRVVESVERFGALAGAGVAWGRPLPLEGQGDGGIGVEKDPREGVGRGAAARSARGVGS